MLKRVTRVIEAQNKSVGTTSHNFLASHEHSGDSASFNSFFRGTRDFPRILALTFKKKAVKPTKTLFSNTYSEVHPWGMHVTLPLSSFLSKPGILHICFVLRRG